MMVRILVSIAALCALAACGTAQDGSGCYGSRPTFATPVRSALHSFAGHVRSGGCMGSAPVAARSAGCMGSVQTTTAVTTTVQTVRSAVVPAVTVAAPPKLIGREPTLAGRVVGSVETVSGRPTLALVTVMGGARAINPSYLEFGDPLSKVTWNGTVVTIGQLIDNFTASKGKAVTVTLHPLVERYGLSLQAEFVAR